MNYYDRQGKQLTLEEWCELHVSELRRVALDEVGVLQISTVWLGLDHSFGLGDGPPLIFETMVFQLESHESLYCYRYTTEMQAFRGHADVLAYIIQNGKVPE